MKVFVVGRSVGYANWIGPLVHTMKEAEIVLFTGGEDINPAIYGETPHSTTYFNPDRDKYEIEAYHAAVAQDKFLIGTCRGAQLICALSGGKLVQHLEGHTHPDRCITVVDEEGRQYQTYMNSLHHQAMVPGGREGEDYVVYGFTPIVDNAPRWKNKEETWNNKEDLNNRDLEIVYFPKIRALGIQGHPEMIFNPRDLDEYQKEAAEKFKEDSSGDGQTTLTYIINLLNKLYADSRKPSK